MSDERPIWIGCDLSGSDDVCVDFRDHRGGNGLCIAHLPPLPMNLAGRVIDFNGPDAWAWRLEVDRWDPLWSRKQKLQELDSVNALRYALEGNRWSLVAALEDAITRRYDRCCHR